MANKKTEIAVQEPREMTSPESLIALALQHNASVDNLERILQMQREIKAERAREAFHKALATFQANCPIITKSSTAGSGNYSYKYASLDHIVSQTRDLISQNGFSYTFDTKKTDTALITYCHVKHIEGHSETSQFEIAIDTGAKMNISQKDGAASSYGKRYAFCNAFGILTGEEDTDAQTPSEVEEKKEVEEPMITDFQRKKIFALLPAKGKTKADLDDFISKLYNKTSVSNLTLAQANKVIDRINALDNYVDPNEIPDNLGTERG